MQYFFSTTTTLFFSFIFDFYVLLPNPSPFAAIFFSLTVVAAYDLPLSHTLTRGEAFNSLAALSHLKDS